MNKTMMKLVVGTEAMFFICLILSFVYMAYNAGFEPHEVQALDIKKTGIFTIILIASSFAFLVADHQFKKGQGREYWRLIHEHITLSSSVFGTSFYALTGFHGFHVFVGLIILSIMLILAFLGDFNKPSSNLISVAGIYWHFVDIVWIVVFTVVYVLPHFTNI